MTQYSFFSFTSLRHWGALIVLLLAGGGLFWTGCDVAAVDNGLKLLVDYSPSSATVAGQIVDAKTQVPIESESVTVRFSGPDAARVIDLDGNVLTELTIPDISLLNFNLDGSEPSADNPAEINLHISAPSYIATSERLLIDSPDYSFNAALTSVSNPPSGVEATVQSFPTNGGAPSEDVTVQTNAEDNTGAQASLRIPEGTVMRTEDGEPLSGDVSATVAYYSNQNDDALAAFPGGFMGVKISGDEGNGDPTDSFITAGFAAIEVADQQGRKARQFDGAIEITIDVPEGTTNPETGQPVESGDMIPVYSFNEETGEWTFEGRTEASVTSASSSAKSRGGLGVSFHTQHLTYWNLDWRYGDYCPAAGRHTFNGLSEDWKGLVWWELRNAETGRLFKRGAHNGGNFLQLWNAPRNWPMTFSVIDRETGETIGGGRVEDLCTDQTWEVNLPERQDRVTMEVHATIVCDADQEIRPSNVSAFYYLPSARLYNWTTLNQGRATLSDLIEGETYRFILRIKNSWEYRSLRIQEDGNPGDQVVVRRVDAKTFRADVTIEDDDGTVC